MAAQRRRHPTLADVADRAGVSKTAASMILNDRPGSRLSADATDRVRRAAQELGYRPNPAARSLRLGTSGTIGLVSDEVTLTRHATGIIRGALSTAREHRHTVLIAEASGEPDGLAQALRVMVDRRVDGILLGLMAARQIELPPLPDLTRLVIANGTTTDGHPGLLPDEWTAGHAMADLLVQHGHRRIGVLGPVPSAMVDPFVSVSIGKRFAGVAAAFEAGGVEPVVVDVDSWMPEIGYDTTMRLMADHPDITAILAGNDSMAFGIYQALSALGLRIPTDVSVASFDDEVLASYHRPGLTTAHLPYEEMGRRGIEMTLGTRPMTRELLPMPVMMRDSVGPPRVGG